MSPTVHAPVMPDEVMQFLLPGPRQTVIDATVGCGGHGLFLWEAMEGRGTLVALDRDPGTAKVPLDKVIATMWDTAQDMHKNYKETSEGGLAVKVSLSDC